MSDYELNELTTGRAPTVLKITFNKIVWYIKQLFPLTYISNYLENGENKLTIWKMWFGKCYNIRDYTISGASN